MLFNPRDMYVGRSFDLYGEFSEGEIRLFRRMVRQGDTVLDLGANIGAHTLFFAQTVGKKGSVYAFEPQRLVFQTLCANLALNDIENVHTRCVAVGKEQGAILVPVLDPHSEFNFAGLSLGDHESGEEVPVITVDGLRLTACSLMKIDVEGMELEALQGAVETIEKFKPILYVENDRPEKSEYLVHHIAELRYIMYWHFPPIYNPENFSANPHNVFGDIVSLNMVCLPPGHPWKPEELRRVNIPPTRTFDVRC